MTDAVTPPGHLDDLRLNAVVDGDASPDEVAHAEGCQRCSGRLAALRAAVALVAAPVAPPAAAHRDGAIATALDVTPASRPRPLALAGREGRRRPAPRWLLPAAAAIALLALAGAAIGALDRADSERVASSSADEGAGTQATEPPDQPAGGVAERASGGGAASQASPPALDANSDLAALVTAQLRQEATLPSTTGPESASDEAFAPSDNGTTCDGVVRAEEDGLGRLRFQLEATWEGRPALLLAYDADPAEPVVRAFVVDRQDCAVLRRDSLPGG